MNLAALGFSVVGLLFASYAVSFYGLTNKRLPALPSRSYAAGYLSLAAALLIWAVASSLNPFPQNAVLAGDALLLVGALFFLDVLTNDNLRLRAPTLIIGIILAVLFLLFRSQYYPPAAFVQNGILVFNTQLPIAVLLDAIFLLVWLPANLLMARKISKEMATEGMNLALSFVYAISTLSAVFFVAFKTVPLVIASFVALGICFVLLFASIYVMGNLIPKKA